MSTSSKNTKIFGLTILFLCVFALFGVSETKAVSLTQPFDINQLYDFQIEFTPRYPGANADVTVKIISYTFDTDVSSITWVLNGKTIDSGKGVKSIKFKTGNIGSSVDLSISVTTETGRKISKSIKFNVGEVDILWQAFSYTPSFYKGKALPSSGSRVKLTVIPQGLGASQNLIYDWRRNFKDVPSASGKGRSSYTFEFSDLYPQEVIKVKVWGANKEFALEKTIILKPEAPEVLLYEEDPLEGVIYVKTLTGEVSLGGKSEMVIRAEPFFFPQADLISLAYNWSMNQKPLEALLDNPNTIGLTAPQEQTQEGSYSLIQLVTKNPKRLLQEVIKVLKINI